MIGQPAERRSELQRQAAGAAAEIEDPLRADGSGEVEERPPPAAAPAAHLQLIGIAVGGGEGRGRGHGVLQRDRHRPHVCADGPTPSKDPGHGCRDVQRQPDGRPAPPRPSRRRCWRCGTSRAASGRRHTGSRRAVRASPAHDWVHAHLHRVEGDLGNAGYWYRRAGRPMARGDLAAERAEMVEALLAQA